MIFARDRSLQLSNQHRNLLQKGLCVTQKKLSKNIHPISNQFGKDLLQERVKVPYALWTLFRTRGQLRWTRQSLPILYCSKVARDTSLKVRLNELQSLAAFPFQESPKSFKTVLLLRNISDDLGISKTVKWWWWGEEIVPMISNTLRHDQGQKSGANSGHCPLVDPTMAEIVLLSHPTSVEISLETHPTEK